MTQLPLEVYRIDMKYIRNLYNIDDRIFSVSPQIGKDERPFLGIIIICNEHKYCVLMSKPKKKHEKMRDKIDLKKIIHNGSLIGVLNFNLMIPVENAQIQRIDTKIRKHDNMDTRRKKELLVKELEWCNEHIRDLANTANVLYQKYITGENFAARKQCLDFKRMELECEKYNLKIKRGQNKPLLKDITKFLMILSHLPTSAYFPQDTVLHIQVAHLLPKHLRHIQSRE